MAAAYRIPTFDEVLRWTRDRIAKMRDLFSSARIRSGIQSNAAFPEGYDESNPQSYSRWNVYTIVHWTDESGVEVGYIESVRQEWRRNGGQWGPVVGIWAGMASGLGPEYKVYGPDHILTQQLRNAALTEQVRNDYYQNHLGTTKEYGHQEQPGSDISPGLSITERGIGSFDKVKITPSDDGRSLMWEVTNHADFASLTNIFFGGLAPTWSRQPITPYTPITPGGTTYQYFRWTEAVRW